MTFGIINAVARRVAISLTLSGLLVQPIAATTTTVTQDINPGLLTLDGPATAAMTPVTADIMHDQTSSGTLGTLEATDSRGSGAGWSVTASSTEFSHIEQPKRVTGSEGSLSAEGYYTGTGNTSYSIKITGRGSADNAQFQVNDAGERMATSSSPVEIGNGVAISFGDGNYQIGDRWIVNVDVIPDDSLTITPSDVTTQVGDATGVTTGSPYTFNNPNDTAAVMTAAPDSGMGQYANTPTLSLAIPRFVHTGNYTATVTETIN